MAATHHCPRDATELLAARLVNPDAAGVVASRLAQENLFSLIAWVESEEGGAFGRNLLLTSIGPTRAWTFLLAGRRKVREARQATFPGAALGSTGGPLRLRLATCEVT